MRMETAGCLNNTNYTDTGPRDLHVADMSCQGGQNGTWPDLVTYI